MDLNPRQKKELSLKHDRRNVYGENSKASRKGIRRRKRGVNQQYRRTIKQSLKSGDPEMAEKLVEGVTRHKWRKVPDEPLGEILRTDLLREIRNTILGTPADGRLFLALEQALVDGGWAPPAIRVLMRQMRTTARSPNSCRLDFDLRTARGVVAVLRSIRH